MGKLACDEHVTVCVCVMIVTQEDSFDSEEDLLGY